ncbi:MAG: hypothetical protein HYY29_03565 [Chloroflexi bacterium]|nr:hypothetical protein [Chloroflexota bacterium]
MKKHTARGFCNYCEGKDTYGIPFLVRESSSATQRAVWVFVRDPEHTKDHLGTKLYPALHLSERNARRLIAGLQQFLGEEKREWPGEEYKYDNGEWEHVCKEMIESTMAVWDNPAKDWGLIGIGIRDNLNPIRYCPFCGLELLPMPEVRE